MEKLPDDIRIRVHGLLYIPVEPENIQVGDLILDLGDFTYGYCDMIHPGGTHIAVRDDWATEVGVPISRVMKLVLTVDHNQIN